jgi:membrane-bound ClpP family serine protease
MSGPIGSMSLLHSLATLLIILGVALMFIMLIERYTPGEGWIRVTSYYALVGAAMVIVGAAIWFTPV